jgi:hypothetical protein
MTWLEVEQAKDNQWGQHVVGGGASEGEPMGATADSLPITQAHELCVN